ncbi:MULTISPECIES: hypothetical protein [Actinokineospora]|uniref:Uncharacterized protein n=1 Tax=Actinokineospora fastidiosa TaxID=1816 RepID=A0A918GA17_9PSEU|nr:MULTISPECIES: hypothetical protein [Actinokineospora]UVS82204.1 hypothetical protein Actkin_05969 [Actinokineospora sp. UTMC 2448]GGS22909.1 hypothetical protein GCM10010171_14730 [Actinokineospora fastidiosa]
MERRGIEALQAVVFVVGIYEGVVPLVSRVFDWNPVLALPLRLPEPYWWIVSVAVIVVAAALLELLESRKSRA